LPSLYLLGFGIFRQIMNQEKAGKETCEERIMLGFLTVPQVLTDVRGL
jgi:hypothetical protein